ncbi:unnamed protein product [Brassica rapa subsp. trilocularis]|uniref:(rape) hypothetical protein n=1 Tax=Brassica napus TaxID=3708 RepID=A0A816YFQ1_BRANA|nr:unnamed protein product [Brassica napus]
MDEKSWSRPIKEEPSRRRERVNTAVARQGWENPVIACKCSPPLIDTKLLEYPRKLKGVICFSRVESKSSVCMEM